jgi:ABC-2 type transport system permease protein
MLGIRRLLLRRPHWAGTSLRGELAGFVGVIERNVYLIKRYAGWELAWFIWSVANTLTIVYIAKGFDASGGRIDVRRETTVLLIGAVIWSYLGVIFEVLTETVAWERWEGTIEYTFMAPFSRVAHLGGMGLFAIVYGLVRAAFLFGAVALFFDLDLDRANYLGALVLLAVTSVSLVGIGMMCAVLPLISPEKGVQLAFIGQGLLLVVSGVYYSVDILPGWMQALAIISPATYALEGSRRVILEGAGLTAVWPQLWPLLISGAVCVPVGLLVFRVGERYAKRHGKLNRSG